MNSLGVDFGDYDDLRPTLHLTLLQLLSLFSILLLLLLVYGLRCLRLKLSLLGRFSDKEAWGTKNAAKQTERESVKLLNDEKRSWWWIDAVVGTDEEERVRVDEHAAMPGQHAHPGKFPRWSFKNLQQPYAHVQTTQQEQPIPVHVPRQLPPISMAKLIMSRHAYPPRRPRSPPTPSNNQAPQNSSSHAPQRSSSRLGSNVDV